MVHYSWPYTIAKIGEAYAEAYDELTKGLKEINTNLDEIQKDLREIADNSKLENKLDHKR